MVPTITLGANLLVAEGPLVMMLDELIMLDTVFR